MLKDLAVGPFVLDFTNSAFDEKPAGGSTFARFVASITILPSKPCTLSRASAIAPPGTATTTASTFETSPPSRPILVTSWPTLSQRSASPPQTLPLPTTATFITSLFPRLSCYYESIEFPGMYLLKLSEKSRTLLQRSLTVHLNGTFRAVLAFVYRPNLRSKRCSYPLSDSFSRQSVNKNRDCLEKAVSSKLVSRVGGAQTVPRS